MESFTHGFLRILQVSNMEKVVTIVGKVTLKMIADQAGVSIGTVDRALNNRGRILPETRDNILKIANTLGYRTNRLASALRKNLHFKIAVVMSQLPHYFTDELLCGFEAAKTELQDYDLELDFFFSSSLAAAEQIPILQALKVEEYDAIAINGSDALAEQVDAIVAQGVPVVTFNSDIPTSRRLFYVGESPYKNGRVAGELMGKMLGGRGTVSIFTGFSRVSSHSARAAGFRDYLNEHYPTIEILCAPEYHDRENEAYAIMQQLDQSGHRPDGIFCVSAVGAIGVGNYLKAHTQPDSLCLIGYDISAQSAQLLQEHYCSALIYQEPRKQSFQLLHLLFDMLSNTAYPDRSEHYTKVGIIISENLQDYIDAPFHDPL